MRLLIPIASVFAVLVFASCRKEEKYLDGPGYFSITQFAADQWENHMASPFTLTRYTTINDKQDSTLLNAYNADWDEVFRIFFPTDIDRAELKDKYEFNTFVDPASDARVLYYSAKDSKVFTKTLQIRIDPVNNRILSIYIEASKKSFTRDVVQKLYYVPMKLIQIQDYQDPWIGKTIDKKIVYRFDQYEGAQF